MTQEPDREGSALKGSRVQGAGVDATGASVTLTEIAKRIDGHLRRMACDPEFNKERFWHSLKTGRQESMGRPLYGASARRAGNRVSVTYVAYQGSHNMPRADALAYLAWLEAGNRGTHFQAASNPSKSGSSGGAGPLRPEVAPNPEGGHQ
jgi:hypothetical protein